MTSAGTSRGTSLGASLGTATRSARSAVRRVVVVVADVVTGLGAGVFLVAVLAWVGALVLGWTELLVLALVLTFALLGAVAFVLGRLSYEVTLDLATRRVTVGDRALGGLLVRNTSSRTALPSAMEVSVGRGVASFPVPRLRSGAVHEDVFRVPTSRRAVIDVGPVRSVRSDPLGLLRREVVWNEPEQLVVHPRTAGLAGSSVGSLHDLEGRASRDLSDSDVSFHALRDYVPGDDRRHIHWRSTARTGQLVVRQFEETRRSQLAVVLSTREEDYASDDEFELAVSTTGSYGLQAIREDRRVHVLTQGGNLRGDSRTRLLDDLAGVERSPSRTTLADIARARRGELDAASVVVLVAGSVPSPADLRAASVRLSLGARALAVRCVPGAAVARHTIGDLTVLTLGSLEDLPRAMRKMND
ncbi:hypothetical protein GCM10025865_05620 [Paraoerskovia sediminicola]|uniref:DUF58 domain-containing protein n=1 Tax=Paraoerskovia sediminicola TaxID=1138587 RepID=A0ABM8FZP9_9CELL|nr:hypothetical protein GCM10025865_05620 [Paraoerskovia sediminicola]